MEVGPYEELVKERNDDENDLDDCDEIQTDGRNRGLMPPFDEGFLHHTYTHQHEAARPSLYLGRSPGVLYPTSIVFPALRLVCLFPFWHEQRMIFEG